jgi:hypothetical protein
MNPNDRQRPILEHRENPIADGVQVVDQVSLRRVGAVEQRPVQVREGDAVA